MAPRPNKAFLDALKSAWRQQARPEQLPPPGDWSTWVFCGGRGAGKTRSGAEWVNERVATGKAKFIHLIAPTAADARDVLLEGPAGILTMSPSHMRPVYQPSLRKVTWPNGAQALLFSSDEPDRLRGVQADTVWCDELCAMRTAQDVLDMAYMGLRLGKDPRCLITTTPRPIKPFKGLLAREGQDVVVTRSSSYANRENLAPQFFATILAKYEGTRLGRQEIEAELLADVPGALWHLERIEELRVRRAPETFERVLIAVDPAVTFGPDSDETGIVAVGLGRDGAAYVLDDISGRYPPTEWAQRAIQAYRIYHADRIVGEVNNGGALVEHTLRSVDPGIPFKAVHASRGKLTRAEPVSALYEQGRVHHVGVFGPLEDQMTSYDGSRTGTSPDRLDALVWGLTELMLGEPAGGFFRQSMFDCSDPVFSRPPDKVFVVIGTPHDIGPERDGVAALYCAHSSRGDNAPLVIVDYDLEAHDVAILNGDWIENVGRRLAAWCSALKTGEYGNGGLWIERTPIGNALIELGAGRRFPVMDATEALKEFPSDLLARVNLTSRYVGTGLVHVAPEALEKATTFRGVMRNHMMSQILAYGSSGTPSDARTEFLFALCNATLLSLVSDVNAAQKMIKDSTSMPHVLHGPEFSRTAAPLATPEPPPPVPHGASIEKYQAALAQWREQCDAAREQVRAKLGNSQWRESRWQQLPGISEPPQNPSAGFRWSGTQLRTMLENP